MKGMIQKGDAFLSSLVDPSSSSEAHPVFAIADVSFWVLRDFGTCLMKRTDKMSVAVACVDATQMHPNHKRVIKTLGRAIKNFMTHNHFCPSGSHAQAHQLKKVVIWSLWKAGNSTVIPTKPKNTVVNPETTND